MATDTELLMRGLCGVQRRLDLLAAGDPRHFPPRLGLVRRLDIPANRLLQAIVAGSSLLITADAVPQGTLGVIRKIGVNTSDPTNTRITTRINGSQIEPLIQVFGAVGDILDPFEIVPIDLNPGEVFSLLLENIGGAPINMAARIIGWYYEPGALGLPLVTR